MITAYNGRLKKIFRRRGENSVAWHRLNEGTLIVNIETAELFSNLYNYGNRLAVPQPLTQQVDCDGYRFVNLKWTDRRQKKSSRRCRRQTALVHRIVWMAANGHVEIPRGVDVHHIDRDITNNHWTNLVLSTERANRKREPMTELELEAINAFLHEYTPFYGECG